MAGRDKPKQADADSSAALRNDKQDQMRDDRRTGAASGGRGRRRWPMMIAGLAMVVGCRSRGKAPAERVTVAEVKQETATGPQIAGCPVFPADNVWNTRVDGLPRDPRSDAYIDSIGVTERLHADFSEKDGIPVTVLAGDTPAAKIKFQYDDESDHVAYPIPWGAAIEGGAGGPGDHHILVVDPKRCLLYELWHMYEQPDGSWSGGSGARFDLRSNALRPATWTSADAAGLAILPGLVRWDEVAAGEIRHAIRFTLPRSQHAFVWPGRHQASADMSLDEPPLGVRLRLRADFDVSKYPRCDRVILTALKQYGMILADRGSAIYISGEPSRHWDSDDLHLLRNVMGQDFEVVDESGLQVGADSGAARQR